MNTLTDATRFAIERAACLLTGAKRRRYLAEIALEFFQGNARQVERELGWGRATVQKGLREVASGVQCLDHYAARGNQRTEAKWPRLEQDIRALVEPHSQADPQLQTPFAYTRITAKAVRQALLEHHGYAEAALPNENTIGNMLNRLGYRLRRVQKTKPQKKIPQTDTIFDTVHAANHAADQSPTTIRISVDTKAKVKLGAWSRGGLARGAAPVQALDHDLDVAEHLVPVGILEPKTSHLSVFFGTSRETSDLIVDCLEQWWEANRARHTGVEEVVINLDGGPHVHSHRTQFIKRMVEFADRTGWRVRLVYYPPYHSKYNPIERCWGRLESHWNGALLLAVEDALEWARTMTWKGLKPVVQLWDTVYEKGVKLSKKAMAPYEARLQRSETLPKWDVSIQPQFG